MATWIDANVEKVTLAYRNREVRAAAQSPGAESGCTFSALKSLGAEPPWLFRRLAENTQAPACGVPSDDLSQWIERARNVTV